MIQTILFSSIGWMTGGHYGAVVGLVIGAITAPILRYVKEMEEEQADRDFEEREKNRPYDPYDERDIAHYGD